MRTLSPPQTDCLPAQVRRSAATCVQPQRDKLSRAGTVEWYLTLAAETPVAMAPGDTGTPVAKVGTIAMPLIGFYPPEREGAPPPPPTHYEVLLPSGRTGWVPVTAVRPLKTDHLCYAHTRVGEWKIAAFDQAERAP